MVSVVVALIGWLTLYAAFLLYIGRTRDSRPEWLSGSLLTILWRSQRGLGTIEWLAARGRLFWKGWGVIGVVALVIAGFLGTLALALSALALPTANTPSALSNPKNVLVIPGVNEFLPLAAAPEIVLALLITLVVHEAGHAVYCRLGAMDIESTGLVFLAGLPMGAFVEPDQESVGNAAPWAQAQMFAAGIMNNFAVTVVAALLLMGVLMPAVSPAAGVGVDSVLPSSPAADAGVDTGDHILAVDGRTVETSTDLRTHVRAGTGESYTLKLADGRTVTAPRTVFVTGALSDGPIAPGARITAVDGTPVADPGTFADALTEATAPVDVTLADGETVPLAPGVNMEFTSAPDGTNVPLDRQLTVVAIDGTPVYTADAVTQRFDTAGGPLDITYLRGDDRVTTTLSEGVGAEIAGTAAVSVTALGITEYPADRFAALLTLQDKSYSLAQHALGVLLLPFTAILPGFETGFAGFTPTVQPYYDIAGVSESFEGAIFLIASVLFWTMWVNFNVALFNCLPAYPLDGGHLVRVGADGLANRLPLGDTGAERLSNALVYGTTAGTVSLIVITIFGPALL
jgi:membrane-associated protease RseP (regulator of RpoE activity)